MGHDRRRPEQSLSTPGKLDSLYIQMFKGIVMLPRMLVVLTLVLAPAPGLADRPSGDKAKARAAFVQGQTLYRQGKFKAALAAFTEASRHTRHPSISINMAQCHRNLGHKKKAVFFYRLYLSSWKRQYPDKPVAYEAEVTGYVSKLQAEIKKEEALKLAENPTGHIRVLGVMVGRAQILVDDAPRAMTPLARPIKVVAGEHEVRVEAAGYHTWKGKVTVEAGKSVPVRVALEPITERRRSTAWLLATIATLALAAGAEAVAIAYNVEANRQFAHTESYHDARDVSVAGHVAAGTLAAAATVCLVFYVTSGKEEPVKAPGVAAAVVPLAGGAAATLEVRF